MKIYPKKGILLIKKHKRTQIKADIIVEEAEEDKRLITGEIIGLYSDEGLYQIGQTVIFGKYAIFPLTLQGEEYNFLEEEDVIGVCDYKE